MPHHRQIFVFGKGGREEECRQKLESLIEYDLIFCATLGLSS